MEFQASRNSIVRPWLTKEKKQMQLDQFEDNRIEEVISEALGQFSKIGCEVSQCVIENKGSRTVELLVILDVPEMGKAFSGILTYQLKTQIFLQVEDSCQTLVSDPWRHRFELIYYLST